MAWYVWAILLLIGLSFFQYYSPEKSTKMLDPFYGKVKTTVAGWFPGGSASPNTNLQSVTCPDVNEPVCAGGITYKNSCEAALVGVNEVTAGGC